MAETSSVWKFLHRVFYGGNIDKQKLQKCDSVVEDKLSLDDCKSKTTNNELQNRNHKTLPNLKRNDTCSIDISDRTFQLMNKHQFKRLESPPPSVCLSRTLSIDLSRDFPRRLEAITNFEELETLGSGAFGRAIKVKHIKSNKYFVMKEVLTHSKENEASIIKEVSLLRTLKHENILVCQGLVLKNKRICLLTELMEGGSLQQKLENSNEHISIQNKLQFLLDISAGMDYLHRNSIMHRDLTSSNCLIHKTGRVVVSDFGLSKFLYNVNSETLTRSSICRSPNYLRSNSSWDVAGQPNSGDEDLHSISTFKESGVKFKNSTMEKQRPKSHLVPLVIESRDKESKGCKNLLNLVPDCNIRTSLSASDVNRVGLTQMPQPADKHSTDQNYPPKKSVNLKRKHTVVGNPFWMAPEMLAGNCYDNRVDVYSFGIIGCEVTARVSAEPDFLDRHHRDMSLNFPLFLQKNEAVIEECPAGLIELIGNCCNSQPEKRPSFSDILSLLEDISFRLLTYQH